MNSLAIKLDVTDQNQQDLNDLLVRIGIKPQRRKFHCTIGFIDKMFATQEDAEELVTALRKTLDLDTPLHFTFESPRFLFRHVIGLVPKEGTLSRLRKVNESLHETLAEITGGQYVLNHQTTGEGYHPHITLWRQRHKDRRFKQLCEDIEQGQLKPLELVEYSYTVL